MQVDILEKAAAPEVQRQRPRTRVVMSPIARLLVQRLLAAVAVLLFVSFAIFLLIHIAPGGPENAILGREPTDAQRLAVRERYHLNDPLLTQYLSYLESVVRLDFGESYVNREPVGIVIKRAATSVTIPLMVMTWLLATSLGVALGFVSAQSRGRPLDRLIVAFTVLAASTPVFVTGLLMAYIFGVRLGWLPFFGTGDGGLDTLKHLVLPAVTTTTVLLAATTKLSRIRLLQVLDEDYVTFARARGLSRHYVVGRVLLRNAAVHLVTFAGSIVIAVIGGLIIVEQVFGLRGVGTQLITSINARDVPVVQGISLMIAVVVVVVNIVVDLLCMAIDPRMRQPMKAEK